MGKFSRDLSEDLEKKVKAKAIELGLKSMGINVEAIRLKKSKKDIGVVLKANDLVALYTGDPDLIAVALYEEAFDKVDPETQDIWIEGLLSQIWYDSEKDKVMINKPELNISVGMINKYKDTAVKKAELAYLTVQQIVEEEKERKNSSKKK